MATTQITKNLGLAISILFLAACGAKKSEDGVVDLGSRAPVTDLNQAANKALAYCNAASSTQLTVKNAVYAENNVIRPDFIKARITNIPESFKDNGTYVQMFRWKANSQGQTYLDTNPIQFRLTYNSYNLSGYMTAMNYSSITQGISALQTTTMKDFFNAVTIIADIRDPLAEFDAIKVVLYNSSNQVVDQVDMLIPVFSANPKDYAVESDGSTRAAILQNLHPFKSMASQTWTQNHYQTVANGLCF